MSKILKDLTELTQAGLITEETAERINAYYIDKAQRATSPLILVFSILGSLMVGLGIVLIIAHNWDDFSKTTKIFYALLPLLIGQLICAYSLFKKTESRPWREAAAVFLFFGIAASIAIVSQVYNIPGDLSEFLLTWMVLSIPVIYVMRSAMTSLLVILGITVYASNSSYFDYPNEIAWYYWLLLSAILPFFLQLTQSKGKNFVYFHRWFLAISVMITLNMFADHGDAMYTFVAYMSLFSFFILLGQTKNFGEGKIMTNAFLVTGSIGSIWLLLILSFRSAWDDAARDQALLNEAFFASVAISILAFAVLLYSIKRKGLHEIHPMAFLFLVFIPLFELGKVQPFIAPWLVNVLVLGIAVVTTWRGAEADNMFILNYGLSIMAVLILCRFFDTDMSFVVRGVLFLIVGFSFFGANYWVLKRRKLHDI